MLGRWIHLPDLHGEVFASDTGAECRPKKVKKGRKYVFVARPCVSTNQIDLFVGGPEWHKHALRMGVMEWEGTIR